VTALYLLLAAAWAWRLSTPGTVPEDTAAQARIARIAAYLGKAPPETLPAILAGVTRMDDTRLAALERWLDEPPLDQLRRITTQESSDLIGGLNDLRDALLLAWLGQPDAPPPHDTHLMIAAAGDRLDPRVVLHAYEQLARQARANREHASATAILQRAAELPGADWGVMRQLIESARLQGEPAAALRALTSWLRRQPPDSPALDEARDAEAFLLTGLDRASEALEKQIRLLGDGSAPPDPAALERALVCACASGETLRLVPWLERALDVSPDNAARLRWARALAAVSELELPAATAYAAYERLLEMNDAPGIARLIALAPAAKKEAECEALLASALHRPAVRGIIESGASERNVLCQRVLSRAQLVTARQAQKRTPP